MENKNQTETTLQDAVERCKKEGGCVRRRHTTKCFTKDDLMADEARFTPGDLAATWTYEPPQKSAFQEWKGGYKSCFNKKIEEYQKEGWNAALDAVLKLTNGKVSVYKKQATGEFEPSDYVLNSDIKELKEP